MGYDDSTIPNTETEALVREMRALLDSETLTLESNGVKADVLVLPTGRTTQSVKSLIDEYRQAPERREGTARFLTVSSLVEHANRFKDLDSVLFADMGGDNREPSLVSVLDYHRAGPEGAPRFGRHRGLYQFPLSAQWKEWVGADDRQMSMADFARFLENQVEDIADPAGLADSSPIQLLADKLEIEFATPAALMAAAKGLSINVTSKITNVINQQSGECTIQFEQQNEAKGGRGAPLKVPGAFVIAIPVTRGAKVLHMLGARLSYRAANGSITWWYNLYRPDRVLEAVVREACERAQEATGLTLFWGLPE